MCSAPCGVETGIEPLLRADLLLALLLLLLACKKKPVVMMELDRDDTTEQDEAPLEGAMSRPVVAGRWTSDHYALTLPEGWSGSEGPAPRLLSVSQVATGYGFELVEEAIGPAGPECTFVSEGSYRSAPVLGISHTRTCWQAGRIVQIWYGEVDGRPLQIRATFPEGAGFQGREAVSPLLRGLTAR